MRKNVLQLVGIAFVVAIAATGLFYLLLAGRLRDAAAPPPTTNLVVAARDLQPGRKLEANDLKPGVWAGGGRPLGAFDVPGDAVGSTVIAFIHAGEPVTAQRVASAQTGGGAALGVPAGMRAVSIHTNEPAGVVSMLRRGHRVDVQAVGNRTASGEPGVRTILENVEVLANSHADGSPPRPAPVITLLATPHEADMLTLADTAASIRLVLRNPVDAARMPSPSVTAPALFRQTAPPQRPATITASHGTAANSASAAPPGSAKLRLRVEIASTPATAGARSDAVAVRAVNRAENLPNGIEILQASHHDLAIDRGATVRKGSGQWILRLILKPLSEAGTEWKLRVSPELTRPEGAGLATRRYDAEVVIGDHQKLLVTGLSQAAGDAMLDRLFPGKLSVNRELVVLITPQRPQTVAKAR